MSYYCHGTIGKLVVLVVAVVSRALDKNLTCITSFNLLEFRLLPLHLHGEGVIK